MHKARYMNLPANVRKKFLDKEGGYNLRGPLNFKKPVMNTTQKVMCISSNGATLWNELDDNLKYLDNINTFKSRLKRSIFERYRKEEL